MNSELQNLWINGQTSLIGLLGDPVNHSLSPVIQNVAIRELGLNWCYLALPCKSENLKNTIKMLRQIDCKGLNITIPHKTLAHTYCSDITKEANEIGAINTLIPHKNIDWLGANTDIEGFLAPLKKLGTLNKENALILGCGGSAKAVLTGLRKLNFNQITISSRKKNSLNTFLKDVNTKSTKSDIKGIIVNEYNIKEHINNANLIINTTPVGMKNMLSKNKTYNAIPYGENVWASLNQKTILYDLIYTPRPTNWLKLGQRAGCCCIDGLEMLIHQGAESLKLWTQIEDIPINQMRQAAEKFML